ncbi:PREDICTED: flowering time control protein FPA isoform X2 [Nelumbo nucifera]|uniref:Flowering time control protein FPA isoform X2 n=1 Tax=Nelumbo nucifera TaxID=4432 RepID=A0A1U8Q617_NELNU|nr:PREDICTED: flowering time control protein FPA isoform X2 [Nelumbo nucifera]
MPHPSKSNMPVDQNPRSSHGGGKDTEEEETPSHNLWVGNLSNDTTDTDLMDVFSKYGDFESVATYSSRNYAFVYFKRLEDAKSAKEALQGFIVRGNPIKIEFARPAKPGKHLWVGGISSSVTKEQLEDEFLKFGKIEEFKFLRDRNSALVEYFKLEDATAALKSMNGKHLGGEQIRVDFLRSQPSRRENWSDFHDSRDGHFNNRRNRGPAENSWMPPDAMRNSPESSQLGLKRHTPSQPLGGRREGQPSNILWIGYPPSVQVDEQMLHNAMILFGEIERIKSFPSRHYSFVEFRSVDEARRAKEGLQGRLFNDPRIQIMFSSSELAPGDMFGQNRPMASNNFPGPLPPTGMPGANMMMRPFGPQGGFDPLHSGPDFNDLSGSLHNFPDGTANNSMGPNWRRLSPPASGMLPSAPGMWPPIRPPPGTWDGFDANPFQREAKRSRIDGPSSIDDAPFSVRKMDRHGIGGDQPYGFGPQLDRGAALVNHSPVGARVPFGGPPSQGFPEKDFCWRGIIAKGGTPVCHARCIPVGKGIDSQLPDIVNCSARTGLDMLTKHYLEASGFDIVFFLPDSEEDFASYTEFLRYLGAKNRAGVAKFDDGTTLFLVPPSDFLTKVLNVSGPERLYGVVLKLPQQMPSVSIQQQQLQPPIPPPQYVAGQHFPPLQADYSLIPQKDDHILQMDYNRASHDDSTPQPPKALLPSTDDSHVVQSVPQDYARNSAPTQVGVSLTPELIATLAALLPTNMQPSPSTSAQLPLGSSAPRPSFPASVTPDKAIQSHGWRSEHQNAVSGILQRTAEEQTSHPSQQLGHQFNTQAQLLSQFPAYANATNRPDQSSQAIISSTQNQDPSLHMPPQATVSSKPPSNFVIPSQGQYSIPQQSNQQYQLDASHNPQKSYGMVHTTDATGLYHSPVFQQPKPPVGSSTQVQGTNMSQAQVATSLVTDKANLEFPNQVQQLQSALSGAAHGTPEGEADKNQRYQSTLQFAASLLLQIQQQQQQTNAQAVQGSGSHQ